MTPPCRDAFSRRRWLTISGAAAVSALACPITASATTTPPQYQQHSAPKSGFFSNSYLFEGEEGCALIDAHLNLDEAKGLVGLIDLIGKPLGTIVITHPHPDHYLGLEYLAPLFPDAVIQSSKPTLKFVQTAAADWSGFNSKLVPMNQGISSLAGRQFECLLLPDAESVAPVVLYEAATKILVAGDHVLNKQHLWLVEGRLEAWQQNLLHISKRWSIDTVLPGHGAVGGPELINATDAYIRDFRHLFDGGHGADHIKQEMLKRYPDHQFTEALNNSILANIR